jgi:hypothetical protein
MGCHHSQFKNLGPLLSGHRSKEAIEEERRLPIDEGATVARGPDHVEVQPVVHAKVEHALNLGSTGGRVVTRLPRQVFEKTRSLSRQGQIGPSSDVVALGDLDGPRRPNQAA